MGILKPEGEVAKARWSQEFRDTVLVLLDNLKVLHGIESRIRPDIVSANIQWWNAHNFFL